eukprot:1216675-Amphidinium_carterae.1
MAELGNFVKCICWDRSFQISWESCGLYCSHPLCRQMASLHRATNTKASSAAVGTNCLVCLLKRAGSEEELGPA